MLQNIKNEVNERVIPLVNDIVEDAELLVRQEIELLKSEVKLQVQSAKAKAINLIIAISFCMVALTLIGMGSTHYLLSKYPELTLGGGFMFIASIFLVISYVLLKLSSRQHFFIK